MDLAFRRIYSVRTLELWRKLRSLSQKNYAEKVPIASSKAITQTQITLILGEKLKNLNLLLYGNGKFMIDRK